MSKIPEYFSNYMSTKENFEKFHNQVINMPRDNFSYISVEAIQSLCAYFLLIENDINNVNGITYPEIRQSIKQKIRSGIYPNKYRNMNLENKFFLEPDPPGDIARLWRHPAEMSFFLGLLKKCGDSKKKIFDFQLCKQLYENEKLFIPTMQNYWFYININNNEDIQSKEGIDVNNNADYRPTYAILKYLKEIGRPATKFEIAILLGRIDEIQTENEILQRAIEIGKELPTNNYNRAQETYFFTQMNWLEENGQVYSYKSSQQPYFKFNTYLLYLSAFDLINISGSDIQSNLITLTEKAMKMLEDVEIPLEVQDLEDLCRKVDNDQEKEAELLNLIILQRTPQIIKSIEQDSILVEKLNKRAIRNIEYDDKGKRKRNKFISELAKLKAKYTCEATGRKTFKMPNGQYYVEAHHIIEFSRENGPDITENLIVLGPEKHMLIHHACREEIDDLYRHLLANGIINTDRFRRMHTVYHCLTEEHIQTLSNKKLISSIDKEELLELINCQ